MFTLYIFSHTFVQVIVSQFPTAVMFKWISLTDFFCQEDNLVPSTDCITKIWLQVSTVFVHHPTCIVALECSRTRIPLPRMSSFLEVHISVLLRCQPNSVHWNQRTRVCQPKAFGRVVHSQQKPNFIRNKHLSSKFDRRCEVWIFLHCTWCFDHELIWQICLHYLKFVFLSAPCQQNLWNIYSSHWAIGA